jgi:transcriptional regulator with XRE-family HTH domain
MKREKKTGDLLGFQQEEIATLLGIKPGLWSMYVLGKRLLPSAAQLRLVKMEVFVEQQKIKRENNPSPIQQPELNERKYWEDQLNLNQINQYRITAKLKKCQEKYECARNGFELTDFLEDEVEKEIKDKVLPHLKDRTQDVMQKNSPHQQEQYEFKLQLLQYDEKQLKKKLSAL